MRVLSLPEDRSIGGADAQADEIRRRSEQVVRAAEELLWQTLRGQLIRRPPSRRPGPHLHPSHRTR